ncbi:Uridine phosphorylase [hydrothermal vent metagenome]|uniref:Uridine phosphorylase n=1 Tax=hydrothermal vent metagenome TaxID=652676 RepID=A0A3B1CZQ6_9ZZZZ
MKNIELIKNKKYKESSVFIPENLLREARRQKLIKNCNVPKICVLDPDGDIVNYLIKERRTSLNKCWACYHTKLYDFKIKDIEFGIIGCAVGGAFAVLLAEQLFASGCELLISITSAGVIYSPPKETHYILIKKALRDEGTSYHYLPPEFDSKINPEILKELVPLFKEKKLHLKNGDSWTTDAPYRETPSAIKYAKRGKIIAVEMEAASLYAFAKAKNKYVVCFAHLTNTMAQNEGEFEKGFENGSLDSLNVIYYSARILNNSILNRNLTNRDDIKNEN